jgi:hypothetical protein
VVAAARCGVLRLQEDDVKLSYNIVVLLPASIAVSAVNWWRTVVATYRAFGIDS